MAAHARLSPSASKIWMGCPGQPALVQRLALKDEGSVYAAEGTAAHEVAQGCLEHGVDADSMVGKRVWDFIVSDEMAAAVQVYLDAVRAEIQDGDEWDTEQKLEYSQDVWGTADFVRYRPSTGELLVADYKHGAGVAVEVENNPQALIYGLMKAKTLGNRPISSVTLMIVQPRCPHEDGPVRRWTVPGIAVEMEFEERLEDAVAATKHKDAPLLPGDHCRWCPAKALCPAVHAVVQEAAKLDFVPGVEYDPELLAKALQSIPIMESWIKAVRAFAFAEANSGNPIPGYKLVEKRATRKWNPDMAVATIASKLAEAGGVAAADLYEPADLRSPAQIEKLLGKKSKEVVNLYTVSESSGLTLAPASDKRPEAKPRADATEDFGAVE